MIGFARFVESPEVEACLIASCRDGLLDDALLAGPGRDLYPPLLPLKTLPNMALAHVSINLGLMGENAAWAGEEGAGWTALHAAWWAVAEGRCAAALAGAWVFRYARPSAQRPAGKHDFRPAGAMKIHPP